MSKKEIQNANSEVSRLACRLAEFKLTQPQTALQENTSTRLVVTRDSSTQTVVPTCAQLAEVAQILEFLGEPIPSLEKLVDITTELLLYHDW